MEVHIGKEIEREYHKSGMKLSEFSKRINTSSRNVYSIFSKAEIKTDQLLKISEVLNFNFFSLYMSEGQKVSEPSVSYHKGTERIAVTLELDGSQNMLDKSIKKITAINDVLSTLSQ